MKLSATQFIDFFYRWGMNVFLKILRIKKREPSLWVFGAWRGESFSDNPRYFFDYIHRNHPEIKAVWITKNKAVKTQLTQKGKSCYLAQEKEARKIYRRAGWVFFTHGYHDFGKFDYGEGAVKVLLGHGMPQKKAYFATNYFQERKTNLKRRLQYHILKIHNKVNHQLTIATSQKTKDFLIQCYEDRPKDVLITGQPRNDALFRQILADNIKQKLGHKKEEYFILYMPTWRDSGNYQGLSSADAPFLNEVISNLAADPHFLSGLTRKKVKLYIKPHPNRTLSMEGKGNLKVLPHHLHLDTQALLSAADLLITDYSSAFIDFALTERPLHFFVPDLETYKNAYNGLFLSFEDLANFWFRDIATFKQVVSTPLKYAAKGQRNSQKINRLYDDPQLKRGNYCENLYKDLYEWGKQNNKPLPPRLR